MHTLIWLHKHATQGEASEPAVLLAWDQKSIVAVRIDILCVSLYTHTCDSFYPLFLTLSQNIFLGEDIRKQLPRESTEFDEINSSWKNIMDRLNKEKNALRGTQHPGTVRTRGWAMLIHISL